MYVSTTVSLICSMIANRREDGLVTYLQTAVCAAILTWKVSHGRIVKVLAAGFKLH